MNKEKDFLVSVVCPLREVNSSIISYFEALAKTLSSEFEQYEVLVVQDGIQFSHEELLTSVIRKQEGWRLIKLSKTHGLDVAITAGLDATIGDVVVVCLPPFDPTDRIGEFVKIAKSGYIGIGQKPKGQYEGVFRRCAKKIFYTIVNRFLKLELPSDTTYFTSLPRQAVTNIQRAKDRFRFLKVVTAQTGLPTKLVQYVPAERDGRIYRTFLESVLLSIDVMTSQSLTLLRFASLMSLVLSAGSMAYLVYALNIYFFKNNVQLGWSSLSVFISGCFCIVGIVLAIATEYLGKLLTESSNRPIYNIASEASSDRAIANSHVVNVLTSSKLPEEM